MLISSLWLTKR
jgi:hypothetical protein